MRTFLATALIAVSISSASADGGPAMTDQDVQSMVDDLLHVSEEEQGGRRMALATAMPYESQPIVRACSTLIEQFVSHGIVTAKAPRQQLAEFADWVVTTKELDEAALEGAVRCHATLKANLVE